MVGFDWKEATLFSQIQLRGPFSSEGEQSGTNTRFGTPHKKEQIYSDVMRLCCVLACAPVGVWVSVRVGCFVGKKGREREGRRENVCMCVCVCVCERERESKGRCYLNPPSNTTPVLIESERYDPFGWMATKSKERLQRWVKQQPSLRELS